MANPEDFFAALPSRNGKALTYQVITHPPLRPATEAFLERFLTAANSFTPKGNRATFFNDDTATMITDSLALSDAAGADLGPEVITKILDSIPDEEFKSHILAAFKD